ncbi:hypothetical protein [Azotobacter beijerinckii]|uniref:hypothetical protein n=1 Tax=Azotobacter beijerinckii TaxID=170623 RepID=UPI001FCE2133|nr:hypothetical protein [Azotobacter beijerinckii]
MRLENTKAKIARVIMKCCEHYGDDSAYYGAIKIYLTQSLKAKRTESAYNLKAKKNIISNIFGLFSCQIELVLLAISGAINSWGRSIARPVMCGFFVLLFFGFIYSEFGKNLSTGLIKSFDITFLVGYTKHATLTDSIKNQTIYAINAFLGLWWYAILVPTVINRISRTN